MAEILDNGAALDALREGEYIVTNPATGLAAGTYFLRVTTQRISAGLPLNQQIAYHIDDGEEYFRANLSNNTAVWTDWVARSSVGGGMTGAEIAAALDSYFGGSAWREVTDLAVANRGADSLDITSSTGADATIPSADTLLAGLMSAADKAKLDGVESGAQVNDPTNLAVANRDADSLDIASSTGTGATVPSASITEAGLMSAADKALLDSLSGGGANVTISDTAPVGPSPGDLWWDSTDGTLYIYYDDGDTAQWVVAVPVEVVNGVNANALNNRIVNPGMRHSQQNGTTTGTTDGYYGADQWTFLKSNDGTITFGQVASTTPAGSPNRVRATVTGTDTSIGSLQYALMEQPLEGQRMADALFGTADARTLLLRFGWKAPAGTYCVALRNAAANRSYVREFTSTGSDQIVELTFPGDTSGTWPTTSALWGSLRWCLAAGSGFQVTGNQWNASNGLATSNQVNFIGTNSQVAELFDVGLYVDVGNEGVFPIFELPPWEEDLRLCHRYFYQWSGAPSVNTPFGLAQNTATTSGVSLMNLPVPMRADPTLSISAASDFSVYNASGTPTACSALSLNAVSNNFDVRLDYTVASGLVAGNASVLTNNSTNARLNFSARI